TPVESPPPPSIGDNACPGSNTQPCGRCGTQTRQCVDGNWSAWSACTGEGACTVGTTQTCGQGGTQTCTAACQWSTCAGATCTGGTWSDWSACSGEGACSPTASESCTGGGTRSGGGSCQWGACVVACSGPATQACGNCGTQTRSCDGSTGQWSAWSACTGEG